MFLNYFIESQSEKLDKEIAHKIAVEQASPKDRAHWKGWLHDIIDDVLQIAGGRITPGSPTCKGFPCSGAEYKISELETRMARFLKELLGEKGWEKELRNIVSRVSRQGGGQKNTRCGGPPCRGADVKIEEFHEQIKSLVAKKLNTD